MISYIILYYDRFIILFTQYINEQIQKNKAFLILQYSKTVGIQGLMSSEQVRVTGGGRKGGKW